MRFLKDKLYFKLFRFLNKNNAPNVSCNNFSRLIYTQTMLIIRSVLTRSNKINEFKKQIKDQKQNIQFNQQTEYKKNNKYKENIDLHRYFLLSIPVISFGLGIWQIKRRKWKLNLIHDIENKLVKSPVSIPENLNDLDQFDYHPIKVSGEFLYENEFIIGPRSLIIDGKAASEGNKNFKLSRDFNMGYNVVTPFKLQNRDLIILVNRGWLPNKYKRKIERKKYQTKGIVEIIGINRLNEVRPQFVFKNIPDKGVWNYRDINQMAKFANTKPVFLDMIKFNNGLELPIGSQTRINIRNEHLNYIVTWFGLSAFTGYYWFRIFIQKKPIF